MGIEELLLDRAKHEGILEGKLEGEYGKTRDIVREMKLKGLHTDLISEITKLSKVEIDEIKL